MLKNALLTALIFILNSVCGTLFSAELLFKDRARYRVKNSIIFQSDMDAVARESNLFSCVYPASVLMMHLNLDGKSARADKKLLNLLKIVEFLKGKKVTLISGMKKLMSDAAKINRCFKEKKGKINSRILDIMRAEIYLKNRFKNETFWVSEEELKILSKKRKNVSSEELIRAEKIAKRARAMALYLASIVDQIRHSEF